MKMEMQVVVASVVVLLLAGGLALGGKCGAGKCAVPKERDDSCCQGKNMPMKEGACCNKMGQIPELKTEEVGKIVEEKAAVVLDARSGEYDDGRRIPGAKSLNAESSEEDIAAAIPEKGQLVVTYCAGPTCPASASLAKRLKALGYTNVKEYPEGIAGWVEAGLEVEKAGN